MQWGCIIPLPRSEEAPEFGKADLGPLRWFVNGTAARRSIESYGALGIILKQGYGLTGVAA